MIYFRLSTDIILSSATLDTSRDISPLGVAALSITFLEPTKRSQLANQVLSLNQDITLAQVNFSLVYDYYFTVFFVLYIFGP